MMVRIKSAGQLRDANFINGELAARCASQGRTVR
jgi:hypothetical protein